MPETFGYSGTPLAQKLGIREGAVITAVNAPRNYRALLTPLPSGARIAARISRNPDFVHIFSKARSDLTKQLQRLRKTLVQDGVIWVSWPKRQSNVATDITEDVIREVALPLGLVDIKVCAVDETWSGLKLVIRRELRRA